MNRKNFLNSLLSIFGILPSLRTLEIMNDDKASEKSSIIPKYLKTGDTIGITCPSGFITLNDIQPAILQMESWGLKIRIGTTVGMQDFTFGGTDEERAEDFQQMLDDPKIKAIMCARGGYGAVRIIDKLNFSRFVTYPKWIIGFSDVTVIHSHVERNYRIASIHSKMCNSFPEDWSKAEPIQMETILSIKHALTGVKMRYMFPVNENNRTGSAEGPLVGGNLKMLETISGTRSDLNTVGKILFVEDTGEYLYSIDRMFWHLKRTKKLSGLKGLIIGGFKIRPDDPGEEFGKTLYDIVLEKVKNYNYPVCFDFPVGHQKNNFALKCGVNHRIEVKSASCTLTEIK